MSSSDLIARLQNIIASTLARFTDSNFALLDFPDYGNVGDSAIWLGELAYFNKLKPSYVCAQYNYNPSELHRRLPTGTIFITGGGNFGDTWMSHQDLREKVISDFPNHKIVQLPQSIHFADAAVLEKTSRYINNHKNFTLLVRDNNSLSIAQNNYSCEILLCPDMAFCLGRILRPAKAIHKTLYLMREDKERVNATLIPDNAVVKDWIVDDDLSGIKKKAILKLPTLGADAFYGNYRREYLYRQLAKARLDRGVKLLASGESVVSDRLHAHILCVLLDIPHICLDNVYGKVSAFNDTWGIPAV